MKIRRVVGVALSLAIHALLIALLLFRLPLPAAEPAKEEAIKVDIVDPPKPPDPPKPQKPVEQKKPRPPAPKQQAAPAPAPPSAAGAPSREEQAFEAGAPDAAADKPEDTPPPAAGEDRTASAPTVADKPVEPPASPKPSPTPPAAMALLRAKMQADAAKEADKPEAEKPQTETPPAIDAKPQEKPAPDTAKTQGARETPKGKDGAADVTLEKMTQAKTQYSKKMLSDPRVKQALGKLPPERRIVQICSIEALEQVRHAKPDAFPDLLVPFSIGGGLISGNVLDAKGGAFRAKDGWFEIAYRCSVDAQTTHVTDFRFELGGPVPRAQWAARKLPAE